MKKLLLLMLAAAVVAGVGFLSIRHYQNYKHLKQHSEQVASERAAEKVEQDRKAEQLRQAAVVNAFNKLYAECQKGMAAYGQIPPASKAKIPAPACGPQLVQ